jgi:hypothetical protein
MIRRTTACSGAPAVAANIAAATPSHLSKHRFVK